MGVSCCECNFKQKENEVVLPQKIKYNISKTFILIYKYLYNSINQAKKLL